MDRYFNFRTLISVTIIKILYVLGVLGILIGAVIGLRETARFLPLGILEILMVFLLIIIAELLWRLICEQWIVLFRIHESVESIEWTMREVGARQALGPAVPPSGPEYPVPRTGPQPAAAGEIPMARLRVISGPQAGQSFTLGRDNITIGRDTNNDITLNDPMVSSVHCRLRYGQGSWFVQDAGSTNGTIVNGERVTARRLVSGDRLELGDTELIFEVLT